MIRFSVILAVLLVAALAPAQDRAPTLASLLARFDALEGLECRFEEEKRIALLAAPLTSQGRIYFAAPGRFLRRVETPRPSETVIVDQRLQLRDGGRVETMSLAEQPVLRGFIDSFRAVLAGDGESLTRFYEQTFAARPDGGWRLTLVPRRADLAAFVAEVHLEGRDVQIEEMALREANGDVTLTRFSDVDPRRRFAPAELTRLFRIEP